MALVTHVRHPLFPNFPTPMSISRINAWFVVYAVTVVFITVSLWFIVRDNTLNGGTTTAKTSVFLSGPGQLNDKGEMSVIQLKEKLVNAYDEVETFVMFIGYPRSGHSLVGALLDAHPEVIIAREYDILDKWPTFRSRLLVEKNLQKYCLYYNLHFVSSFEAMFGWRSKKSEDDNDDHFYSYHVPQGWQGTFKNKIKVIGDKKGGGTITQLSTIYQDLTVLDEIKQVVGIPMKFIHVTRNPYDNIATLMLRRCNNRDKVRDGTFIVNNATLLNEVIAGYLQSVATVQRVRQRYGDAVLDIDGRELLFRPRETMTRLCSFLGVTCSKQYLDSVSKILYGKPSITRTAVVWTESQKRWVAREMEQYTFFPSFSFDEFS